MTELNVRTILVEWLQAHGYDGLCSDKCRCMLSDLMPCDEPCADCSAGFKVMWYPDPVNGWCPDTGHCNVWRCDGHGGSWYITRTIREYGKTIREYGKPV